MTSRTCTACGQPSDHGQTCLNCINHTRNLLTDIHDGWTLLTKEGHITPLARRQLERTLTDADPPVWDLTEPYLRAVARDLVGEDEWRDVGRILGRYMSLTGGMFRPADEARADGWDRARERLASLHPRCTEECDLCSEMAWWLDEMSVNPYRQPKEQP